METQDYIQEQIASRALRHLPDYYYTSAEFGSRWEDAGSAELVGLIIGYDPLFVTFVDESHSRTFPLSTWEIDFGDGCFYGLTSGERSALSSYLSTGSLSAYDTYMSASPYYDASKERPFDYLMNTFELPGDMKLLLASGMNAKKYTESRHVEQFKITNVMSPKDYMLVEEGNPMNVRYPRASGRNPGYVHVTSMKLNAKKTDVGADYYGDANALYVDALGTSGAYEYDEIFKKPATNASVYFDNMRGDDCSHVGMKFSTNGHERPVFGHMYKGPGVYTATFRIKPSSNIDYYGQLLSGSNFDEPGVEYLSKTIVVRPTCPCIRTKVYDVYERDEETGDVSADKRSGHPMFKRRDGKLMHAALSSYEYSADDPENYGGPNCDYIDFNPEIFRLYSTDKEKIFEGVSGYAPFVMASVKGMVRPNSFPVSAVGIDHGDWFTDRLMDEEEAKISAYDSGWPFWVPKSIDGKNAYWDEAKRAIYMTNTHTFVMPGLYRANAVVRYDTERIPDFWYSELSACDSKGTGTYYVLVQEIFPKDPKITVEGNGVYGDDGSNTYTFTASARAGSFPIEDVEWDFGDGTEHLLLTRNASGGYAQSAIYMDNTTAEYIGKSDIVNFDPNGVDYGALDASAGSACAVGHQKTSGVYAEFDPRDWKVTHRFYRTSIEDFNGCIVSAMFYAANTHSMALATSIVGLSGLPDFKAIEGDVRVVDTRLATANDDLIVTMEGDTGEETNLYTLEWKGRTGNA